MKTGRYVLILFLILVLYLIAWPIPINPISWTPLPAPELMIPSIQVNIRAGKMPPKEEDGNIYLKVPISGLKIK